MKKKTPTNIKGNSPAGANRPYIKIREKAPNFDIHLLPFKTVAELEKSLREALETYHSSDFNLVMVRSPNKIVIVAANLVAAVTAHLDGKI